MQKYVASSNRLVPRLTRAFSSSGSPDVNFDDISVFKVKGNDELLKTLAIQSVCKVKPLVSNANALIRLGRRIAGDTVVDTTLKYTFFKHFCGGVDLKEVQNTMGQLDKLGVGTIVDFAAEYDLEDAKFESTDPDAELNRNCNDLVSSISLSSKTPKPLYVAMKVTSLVAPETLLKISGLAHKSRATFPKIASGSEDLTKASITRESFIKAAGGDESAGEIFDSLVSKSAKPAEGKLAYGDWLLLANPIAISAQTKSGEVLRKICDVATPLTEGEVKEANNMITRSNRICETAAKESNVRILIDAEHARVQAAIDWVAIDAGIRYNTSSKVVVMNTYQCYLKDAYPRMILDLNLSERYGVQFGAKIVRGAYMRHERAEAASKGLPDPIQPTLEATHANYNTAVSTLLDAVKEEKAAILLGTHNENSVKLAVEGMRQRGILPSSDRVAFGQLLGMSDNITMKMGALGFGSYKYVPYGPVKLVLPYLLRRAEENSDMLGSGGKEMSLVKQTLKSRFSSK